MYKFSQQERKILLDLAKEAIQYGLKHREKLPVDVSKYPSTLQKNQASFVTLKINDHLRGCIGSLQAYQPLVKDIASNAYAAAFSDPRFPPLSEAEFSDLNFHISVLNKPEPMTFKSEDDLLGQIRAGIDGLILTEGQHRGTFLPSVWEQIATPQLFLAHLKLKAGLPEDYWSDTLKVQRYTVESVE